MMGVWQVPQRCYINALVTLYCITLLIGYIVYTWCPGNDWGLNDFQWVEVSAGLSAHGCELRSLSLRIGYTGSWKGHQSKTCTSLKEIF